MTSGGAFGRRAGGGCLYLFALLLLPPSASLLFVKSTGKSCERRRARGVATSCISGAALPLESVDSGPIVHFLSQCCSVRKDYTLDCFPSFMGCGLNSANALHQI